MPNMIDVPYTLSDGTEGFCQVSDAFLADQIEAFKIYVVERLEANLHGDTT